VYQAYGMHCCLNAISGPVGLAGCVLIRALEPLEGADVMARRRGVPTDSPRLASGPGNLTRALAITVGDTGVDLTVGPLTIGPALADRRPRIARGPRVGITRDTARILRFWIAASPCVSRGAATKPRMSSDLGLP
jgi:DNA-3-methyladenine glycosylase